MKALVLDSSGLNFRTDYPSKPNPSWVAVDVKLAGICETDLQLVQGYMGFDGVLGHEFVGIARGGKFEGQRVVGEINCSCQQCEFCERMLPNHCPNRSVIGILNHDGAFAETVYVPEENLRPVPSSLSDQEAVFTEPLAAAYQIPAQINFNQYNKVAVVGDGRLGYLIAQVAAAHHSDVTVFGKHESKLKRFERFGLQTIDIKKKKLEKRFDIAIDCTGSSSGMETCLTLLQPLGTLVLKTTVADPSPINLAGVVIDEINVVGSRCGPFDVALEALDRKEIETQSLISASFPLSQGIQAFEAAASPNHQKVLLEIG